MNRLIYDYLVDSGFKESAYVLKEETTVAPTKVNQASYFTQLIDKGIYYQTLVSHLVDTGDVQLRDVAQTDISDIKCNKIEFSVDTDTKDFVVVDMYNWIMIVQLNSANDLLFYELRQSQDDYMLVKLPFELKDVRQFQVYDNTYLYVLQEGTLNSYDLRSLDMINTLKSTSSVFYLCQSKLVVNRTILTPSGYFSKNSAEEYEDGEYIF